MVAFRDGLKQTITRPDWTLLSLSMYLALPFVWWTVSMERFPFLSSLVIDYVISILVWSVGLIACLRSRVSWQKALCLQLGLMLAPNTADLVSHIFWSDARWWQNIWPFSPWIIPVIFLTFGLPWLGLMFAPALLLPFHRLMFSPRFFSPSMERNPPFSWKESDSKRTLLLWVGATCAGLAIPIIPLPIPIRVLVGIFLLGILQEIVLRRFWDVKGWWILASAGGLVCGSFLSVRFVVADLYVGSGFDSIELDPLLIYSTLGAVTGSFQWFVLRRRVQHAYWWVLVNMFSWPAAWIIPIDGYTEWLVMGLVVGVTTGLLLLWLLRFPNPESSHPGMTYEPNQP